MERGIAWPCILVKGVDFDSLPTFLFHRSGRRPKGHRTSLFDSYLLFRFAQIESPCPRLPYHRFPTRKVDFLGEELRHFGCGSIPVLRLSYTTLNGISANGCLINHSACLPSKAFCAKSLQGNFTTTIWTACFQNYASYFARIKLGHITSRVMYFKLAWAGASATRKVMQQNIFSKISSTRVKRWNPWENVDGQRQDDGPQADWILLFAASCQSERRKWELSWNASRMEKRTLWTIIRSIPTECAIPNAATCADASVWCSGTAAIQNHRPHNAGVGWHGWHGFLVFRAVHSWAGASCCDRESLVLTNWRQAWRSS